MNVQHGTSVWSPPWPSNTASVCLATYVKRQMLHESPLAVFQMNCLRRIYGISLRYHVPNVDILTRCNTFSVESQLQSKRLSWLGHMFRMPDDRLPEKLLFGQVKGCRPPGCPIGLVSMMLQCMIVNCVA